MTPAGPDHGSRWEWIAVAVLTVIGAGLRLWPIGHLGLTHFDEGIYALVASWVLMPKGLAAIDPILIAYAPPGYPILGGLAYAVLGRSDGAMIAVSQVAGTLTIPVVAWFGRRTFGPGAGFASAVFCAFSGPHIAFSRMALTDVSFLLAWLLALGAGMRFLERPGFARAMVMGLAVGVAQEFKYNGWLSGGIVIGSAVVGMLARPEGRKAGSILGTFGWGGLAAGVAWLVVWPWFAFVEAHGGYSALLRHQRSYLGGSGDWWPNLLIQADQAVALSGGSGLVVPGLILSGLASWICGQARPEAARTSMPAGRRLLGAMLRVLVAWFFVASPWWLGLIAFPWLVVGPRPAGRMVGVWWVALALSSPFYHPYARLWLPFHACHWLVLGWLVSDGFGFVRAFDSSRADRPRTIGIRMAQVVTLLLAALGGFVHFTTTERRQARPQPDLFAPSDSLYQATVQLAAILPDEVKGLRLLVRPPVTYYLAGRVGLYPMSGSDQLSMAGGRGVWALVDSAILRSELGEPSGGSGRNLLDRFAKDWEVVEEFPTTLSLPTMLDLDPGAARRENADRSCPLWLLRPRRTGPSR